MGKRSDFERRFADKYMTTDPRPVRRLQPYLPRGVRFAEPCAGKGDLIRLMKFHGHECVHACDLYPGRKTIERRDAMSLDRSWRRSAGAAMFITNPPWTREILHELMEHLPSLLPTWLLLDASWAFTKQAAPYLKRCKHIVAVGRVRWIEDSSTDGVDDCAWYFFVNHEVETHFHGLA